MKLPYPKAGEKKRLESMGGGSCFNKLMLWCVDREEFASALRSFAMKLNCNEKIKAEFFQ